MMRSLLLFVTYAPMIMSSSAPQPSRISFPEPKFIKRHLQGIANRAFDRVDRDGDNKIEFDEAYEMMLRVYIEINRNAFVDAPSRSSFMVVFRNANVSKTNYLTRDEFSAICTTSLGRAFTRIAAFKAVQVIGAPLLASKIVNSLEGRNLARLSRGMPYSVHLKKKELWKTVLTVLFVDRVGNVAVNLVNSQITKMDNARDLGQAS